jgi:hypothetical protein
MKKSTKSKAGQNMGRPKVNLSNPTIGIDLGDKFSHYCVLNPDAEVIEAGQLQTTREALTARFVTMSPGPSLRIIVYGLGKRPQNEGVTRRPSGACS